MPRNGLRQEYYLYVEDAKTTT